MKFRNIFDIIELFITNIKQICLLCKSRHLNFDGQKYLHRNLVSYYANLLSDLHQNILKIKPLLEMVAKWVLEYSCKTHNIITLQHFLHCSTAV